MPTTREIKRRIVTVKNITQVTRALEAVAASNVRKSQNAALASRPYAQHAYEVLVNLAAQERGVPQHPLLEVRDPVETIGMMVIAGDRGLAGAYNTNIIRRALRFVEHYGRPVRWITVGRRGGDLIRRWIAQMQDSETAEPFLKQQEIVAEFSHLPADLDSPDVKPIVRVLFDEFMTVPVDEVFIAYTHFINTMTQQPRVLPLLPLRPFEAKSRTIAELVEPDPEVEMRGRTYQYEPDALAILNEVIPAFIELQILQAIRESLSSEHSARMVAMRNASESADALSEALQVEFNKARQLAITSEILDIIGGVEALSQKNKT
ncbi:MAG: ATP synthase F1 subunit gamma [Anaerolineae bacterium]|nr:ATP synthase F1 subunit gamma [Anaerolineae bacterium]